MEAIGASSAIGWRQPGLVGGPEPTIDVLWLEVLPVATVKVTKAAGGPNVLGI